MYPHPCHLPIATTTIPFSTSHHTLLALSSTLHCIVVNVIGPAPTLDTLVSPLQSGQALAEEGFRGRVVPPPPFTFCNLCHHRHDRLLLPLLLPCVTTQEEEADANHPNAPVFALPPPLHRCCGRRPRQR